MLAVGPDELQRNGALQIDENAVFGGGHRSDSCIEHGNGGGGVAQVEQAAVHRRQGRDEHASPSCLRVLHHVLKGFNCAVDRRLVLRANEIVCALQQEDHIWSGLKKSSLESVLA